VYLASALLVAVALALVVYVHLGYPVMLALLGRGRTESVGQEIWPRITVFVPAHNEGGVIGEKIENCLRLEYPRDRFEVVVASDGSSDDTAEIARRYEPAGVRVFESHGRGGKNSVINAFLPQTTGEIVVFTDANSFFEPQAMRRLASRFADPTVGCVVGNLVYVDQRTQAGRGEGLYFRYESAMKRLESKLGALVAATGSIYAIRRTLFSPLDPDVANDFAHPIQIQAQGWQVVFEAGAVATEKATGAIREEFSRKVRIVTRGLTAFFRYHRRFRMLRGTWGFCFVSHKLLRWFTPLYLLTALGATTVAAAANGGFLWLLCGQLMFYALALAGWAFPGRGGRLLTIPFYFSMINLAALVAIVSYLRGTRRTTWASAPTTR
jgi:cellulose synthase/poly-beta-1,6-N-acetylglucosamine synthase-like glycosyltransferase